MRGEEGLLRPPLRCVVGEDCTVQARVRVVDGVRNADVQPPPRPFAQDPGFDVVAHVLQVHFEGHPVVEDLGPRDRARLVPVFCWR